MYGCDGLVLVVVVCTMDGCTNIEFISDMGV